MTKRFAIGAVLTAAFVSLAAGTSHANTTVSPAIGRAVTGSQDSCFDVASDIGWVANRCGATEYIIPLAVDTNGAKTVTVTVWAPSAANTWCHETAAAKNGTQVSPSIPHLHTASASGTTSDIVMTEASVPSGGGLLWVQCHVGAGASITSINYKK
jgi:hypothetical protein